MLLGLLLLLQNHLQAVPLFLLGIDTEIDICLKNHCTLVSQSIADAGVEFELIDGGENSRIPLHP